MDETVTARNKADEKTRKSHIGPPKELGTRRYAKRENGKEVRVSKVEDGDVDKSRRGR
jgi:hypothetical protein